MHKKIKIRNKAECLAYVFAVSQQDKSCVFNPSRRREDNNEGRSQSLRLSIMKIHDKKRPIYTIFLSLQHDKLFPPIRASGWMDRFIFRKYTPRTFSHFARQRIWIRAFQCLSCSPVLRPGIPGVIDDRFGIQHHANVTNCR